MTWFYIILACSIVFGWMAGATLFIRRDNTPKRVMIYGALIGTIIGLVWGSIYSSYHKDEAPRQNLNPTSVSQVE